MTDPDLLGLFIRPLERLGLSYMITGGVASVIYGDPRFTRDIDVVLELQGSDVGRLVSAFPTRRFYIPAPEVLEREVGRPRGGHFNVIHGETALRADVYLKGEDPMHAWAFERRERIGLEEMEVWVAPVEYVILRKLEYFEASGSERHLRDVAMILRISGESVEERALAPWIERLGLEAAIERARDYEI